jgi:hypothetical protein
MRLITFFVTLLLSQSFIPKQQYRIKVNLYNSYLKNQLNNITDFTNFLNNTQYQNNENQNYF